jgi:hypothetical protein
VTSSSSSAAASARDVMPARPLADTAVRRAMALVDDMDVLEVIASWRSEERRGPGGRPETFPMGALLAAMVLCVTTGQPLLVTTICDVLYNQISPALRLELGIQARSGPVDRKGRLARYRNVRTRLHGLLGLMDPSPFPKNERLEPDDFADAVTLRLASRSEADLDVHRDRLTWFVNQVLEASFRMLPRDLRHQWKGSVAVDATVVPAYARAETRARAKKGKKGAVVRHSSDPDAAWYHRDPDHRDETAARKASVWGYELSIAVTGNDDPDTEPVIPSLVLGMALLHQPSVTPGQNAVVALSSIHARGHPSGWLAADRAYTNSVAEKFQLPVRALGYRPVLDYMVTQLGVQNSYEGMLQVEGAWYCPSMPQALIDATIDFRNQKIDEATYRARLAERSTYRILSRARSDAEGHARVRCPASNPAPVMRCALKPVSVSIKTQGRGRVVVPADVAAHPPLICAQQSLTVPPEAEGKLSQNLLYGSDEWHAHYSTLRNSIEGFNGFVKDGAHEALDDPERRRVRGVAAQSVFTAFLLFGANLRKIATFLSERAAVLAGTLRRLPRRRKTASLGAWMPDVRGATSSGPDPPVTA